jgi:hypothetical protein
MDFHGIDMQGPFANEILDVLPVFDLDRDERRLVYLSTDDTLYLGTSSGWCPLVCGTGVLGNTADVMIRKFICDVDLTVADSHVIYTVGEDAMFLINTFEVILEEIEGDGIQPYVQFGVDLQDDVFVPPEQLDVVDMVEPWRRQCWSKPHGAALENTDIIFKVGFGAESSYDVHKACVVVTGYLLPNDVVGPNIPYPCHNIMFAAQEFNW